MRMGTQCGRTTPEMKEVSAHFIAKGRMKGLLPQSGYKSRRSATASGKIHGAPLSVGGASLFIARPASGKEHREPTSARKKARK